MYNRNGAVAAALSGAIGRAGLEGVEVLMVAAGGGDAKVTSTHRGCRDW